MKKKYIAAAGAAILMPLLLIRSEDAARGVYDGLLLCGGTLIPALFPFMAAAEIFASCVPCKTRSGAVLLTFILSFAGGYPAGARCTSKFFSRGLLDRRQASMLFLSCFNTGPAFAVTAVGIMMRDSLKEGLLLWGINAVSCIITALGVWTIYGRIGPQLSCAVRSGEESRPAAVSALSSALTGIMTVCGFTLLFTCLLQILAGFFGKGFLYTVAAALLEVTNGCLALSSRGSLCIVSACIGLGGLCVWAQNMSFAKEFGISFRAYAAARIFQAAVSFTLALPFSSPLFTDVFSGEDALTAEFTSAGASASVGIFLLTAVIAGLVYKICSPKRKAEN